MNFNKNNTKSGFTLIELLVVIAIIGLLSSVVLASLNTARAKARDAKRLADLKQLQTAIEIYKLNNGVYLGNNHSSSRPQSEAPNCYTNPEGQNGQLFQVALAPLVTSGLISQLPQEPLSNRCYIYSNVNIPGFVSYLGCDNVPVSSYEYVLQFYSEQTTFNLPKTTFNNPSSSYIPPWSYCILGPRKPGV